MRKKAGESLSVDNYQWFLVHSSPEPLTNLKVNRELTLKQLDLYKKVAEFPLRTYIRAYNQIKKIHNTNKFQMDFVNPNNILIEQAKKTDKYN